MTLVLALLALPLGRLRPRQSRFARVWMAVLLFALYANLLQVARAVAGARRHAVVAGPVVGAWRGGRWWRGRRCAAPRWLGRS